MATLTTNEINDGDIFFERKIWIVTEGLDPAYFNWLYNKIASKNKENANQFIGLLQKRYHSYFKQDIDVFWQSKGIQIHD
jgi:hypothetical protein